MTGGATQGRSGWTDLSGTDGCRHLEGLFGWTTVPNLSEGPGRSPMEIAVALLGGPSKYSKPEDIPTCGARLLSDDGEQRVWNISTRT